MTEIRSNMRKQFKEGTLLDESGNVVADKEVMQQMIYKAERKASPSMWAYGEGGKVKGYFTGGLAFLNF